MEDYTMSFKRVLKYFLPLAVLSAMLLAACGGSQPSAPSTTNFSGTITIWHGWQGSYLDAKMTIFNAYMKLHPGVHINLVHQDSVVDKSSIAVKNGTGPDIIAWVDDQLGKLVLGHIVIPADQYISSDYINSTYNKAAAEAVTFNGHVYGVPESVEAVTIMYNKKLVTADQLPKNTDDMVTFEQTYAKAHPGQYGIVWPATTTYSDAGFFYGFGAQFVTPDGQAHLNTPQAVAAANYIASFRPYLPKQPTYDATSSLFTEGKAAAIINGPWAYADYATKAGIDVGFAKLPIITATNTPGKPFVGVKSLWITKNAKDPALDADLLKFYTNASNQVAMSKVDGEVPANLAADNDPSVTSNPAISGFAAQAQLGVALPNTPFMSGVWTPMDNALAAIWAGSTPVATALNEAETAAQKNISQITS